MEKILIIEDTLYIKQSLQKLLNEAGFKEIFESDNEKEALELCKNKKIDLIIYDICIQNVDWFQFLRNLIELKPQIKILVLSRLENRENIIKALYTGATDYIMSPLNENQLLHKIQRILSLKMNPTEKEFLLSFIIQIIEDIEIYIDSSIQTDISNQILNILRTLENDYPKTLYFNEDKNQIQLIDDQNLTFDLLNNILIKILEKSKEKVENYLPYATNIFIEAFRFTYLKNKNHIKKMKNKIKFPSWLSKEVEFIDGLLDFLFEKKKNN
ncbi:MAG: response regulator [Candidatus Lokiarchaeota archaeon]|nr:response regulator [Candidatus Harpocratesius repetitus]